MTQTKAPFLPLFATFADLVSAVKLERGAEAGRAGRFARQARIPWVRSRGTWLCTSNKNGPCLPRERGDCPDWDGTKREIVALIAKVEAYYPEVERITIEGGYDAAERLDDFDNGNYEPWVGEWEVLVWSRTRPSLPAGTVVTVEPTPSGERDVLPAANWLHEAQAVTLIDEAPSRDEGSAGTLDVVDVRLADGTEQSVYDFNIAR